ncbi:efflux RND transporter periplasmic adaptor subunit [Crassaminicella profunda]|uniref:efflux RND transporter periplasmic adaptor subunit n=1 Tax=Crassaminicella profunda TaxID=1286698 RepID=UPI001CA6C700|nr:efflux RND transporter periplasmic adaptor subunit [Crassaminicella profunda]QZY54489.1 efflux RND transporter periplasmic adaptor subunit [Crassaminicella profunda]
MKKLVFIVGWILIINSFLLVGCGGNKVKETDGKDVEELKKEEVVYVKAEPVRTMDFTNEILLPGNLKPKEEAVVTAEVNGKVKEIYGDLGSNVRKGQSLCKLDDTTYQLAYENKNKDLSMAHIEYNNLTNDYERIKALYENNVKSKSEFEIVEKEYKKQKESLGMKENDVALAKKNMEDTNIKSPISGIISSKKVLMGQMLSVGTELFKLVNIDQMYVEVGIAEKDMPFIKKGQKCIIKVEVFSDTFEGKITNIGPEPEQETKTYPVKILINNEKRKLKSGMFATAKIILDQHKDALAVPKKAVIKEKEKYYVFVDENKKAVKREVKIGFSSDDAYEILEGVKKGEQIIVVGHENLEDGSVVEIK